MATPSRFPQGITNAAPWQFFSGLGVPNPFFYHQFIDDFDTVPSTAVGWTATGTGSVALGSTDGGDVLLTTAASALSTEELQRTNVTFMPTASKKLYFVARITLSDIVNAAFVAGLMPITGTPFTPPANGIWISKASSSSTINLNVANNSVVTTNAFPTGAFTLTNNVQFDVGFLYTPGGTKNAGVPRIVGSISPNLVGYIPQSGAGAANSTNRTPNVTSTAPTFSTLNAQVLAPVLAVQTGNSSILSMTVDFVGTFGER